ncbi:MAG TPA: aspartate-semialdehyde dehydrogenase [Parachlamydiaceae bacterium]|nr:aspartate-semialdehyde dehydrogenase [Parachlamydiaceae bacterium]
METTGYDFHFRDKITVAILGATGSVGQRFIALLANHPWFEIVAVAASERSYGKLYGDVVNWLLPTPLPENIASLALCECKPPINANLVFSALDSSVATVIESSFANAGYLVISNAKNYRMQSDVPLLVPEINSDHLALLEHQKFGKGKIVTNPNCSTIGLSLALKPLYDHFGIEAVNVVTMQAISGAGFPGVSSMDILDNVIPHIVGEEHKLETEPLKILGKLDKNNDRIIEPKIKISAQCNRVPVTDGHTECVSIKLKTKPSKHELIEAWRSFSGEVQRLELPSAPQFPIHYLDGDFLPQPKLQRNLDKGMAVSIGRLRDCPLLDYKFTLVSHNTIRGAAGGAILCAELLVRKGYIFW